MSSRDAEKLPWFPFFVNDWRSDIDLRSCSSGACGLWIDMLCLMHHREPYGTLADADGAPLKPAELARLLSRDVAEVEVWLAELEKNRVFSRDEKKRIYSRRMQRDQHIREVRSAAGKKGGRRTANKRGR